MADEHDLVHHLDNRSGAEGHVVGDVQVVAGCNTLRDESLVREPDEELPLAVPVLGRKSCAARDWKG